MTCVKPGEGCGHSDQGPSTQHSPGLGDSNHSAHSEEPSFRVLQQQALHLMPARRCSLPCGLRDPHLDLGLCPQFRAFHFRADGTRMGRQCVREMGRVLHHRGAGGP